MVIHSNFYSVSFALNLIKATRILVELAILYLRLLELTTLYLLLIHFYIFFHLKTERDHHP